MLLLRRLLHGLGLHCPASPPSRSRVLEHALPVVAEHPVEGARHGIRPEEIMIESIISIQSLCGVQREQLIYQITGKCILLIIQIENMLL